LIQLVEERFSQGGLKTLSRRSHDGKVLLCLTTTQKNLEETAERVHLMKITADTKTVEYFTVRDRLRFCEKSSQRINASAAHDQFTYNRDEHGIFTSNEWALLVRRILDNVTVLPLDQQFSELSQILDQDYRADYHVRSYDENANGSIRELTESFRKTLREHGEQSACLRHVLQTYNIVDRVSITHLPKIRRDILHKTWRPWYRLNPPVDDIQNYYGWEISFYFAWMGFLTRWLLFPGIVGLFFFALRWYRQDTIDEDECVTKIGVLVTCAGTFILLQNLILSLVNFLFRSLQIYPLLWIDYIPMECPVSAVLGAPRAPPSLSMGHVLLVSVRATKILCDSPPISGLFAQVTSHWPHRDLLSSTASPVEVHCQCYRHDCHAWSCVCSYDFVSQSTRYATLRV
jgi:hypothetical protein